MSDFLLSSLLRDWYRVHKRALPWRKTRNPYHIWISEIILQQTRVQQGLDYYNRFMERFPNVNSLAEASGDEVLKYWQGLGYYSRARNLHTAAKQIMEEFDGVFPQDYPAILSLKGVGEYTAAAIASFAYDLPYAVLDGNVYRVLSRLFALDTPIDTGKGKKEFTELANLLLDPKHAATHNQAMMELGALQCVPVSPDCTQCPLQEHCLAFAIQSVNRYPVKQGKTKVRDRWFNYFYVEVGEDTFLAQRGEKDIWAGLYEFPLIETESAFSLDQLICLDAFQGLFGNVEIEVSLIMQRKHILSHQRIHTTFYRIRMPHAAMLGKFYQAIPRKELDQYPVSRLTHICIEQL